ncbi:MAG: sulfite exporter TauE/SafE family protein [Synechococcaceae cyanobacterium SM2_3_60]|nr:sulfite exporter TauE/SafE family protein [Synechococcaceae cyanobacterium SM2_3_60]
MVDSLFLFSLGFLGSFGHCVGMCGPLMLAMGSDRDWRSQIWLQVGRLLSYTLAGLLMGGLSGVLIDGAQWAGIGSDVRRWVAVGSGIALIWLGLGHIRWLPHVQHPLLRWHQPIERWMSRSQSALVLGLIWGLLPCGFLYTAQLRALSLGNVWLGGLAMFSFGLGTLQHCWESAWP